MPKASMRETTIQSDITVVGGGLAGVCAAIAAARGGAHVALVQNRPVLGGNSSSEIRVWVCGATAHGAQKYARENGIMGELFLENQYRNPEGNPILWDQVVHDAVRAEDRIRLFLNTEVREVEASGLASARSIRSVTGGQLGSETTFRFESALFVDATGDGIVGALAGAEFRQGRESRSEFGEDWAPERPDTDMLGSTLLFYTKDTGQNVRFVAPSIAKDISKTSIVSHRRIAAGDSGCDYWWIEWGGERDVVHDNELIRDELWAIVYGIWDHIKNSGEFDADTLTLEWVGNVPGKREYRRFVGDYTLTQHDVMDQTTFDDRVTFGGWSIDLHPPGGMYATAEGSKHLFTSGVYHVPWRSLYSRNVENMLMAGRNISATHVAFGTTRVMATCAAIGEVVGVGAALAGALSVTPRDLGRTQLPALHAALLRSDAPVLGVEWTEQTDAALDATVSASSELRLIDTSRTDGGSRFPVDEVDLGLLIPADPRIETIEVLFDARQDAIVDIELWSTERGESHIPVRMLEMHHVHVAAGRAWARVDFAYRSDAPEELVVVVRRTEGLAVLVHDREAPYGVLALVSREPRSVPSTGHPPTNAWSAIELRRRSVALRVTPETDAYGAHQAVGGYARPFAGPRLWSSAPLDGGAASLELSWDDPVHLAEVGLLFNDDVDEDVVNLHHHRTPFEVIPELVRDYTLTGVVQGHTVSLAEVSGNRRRHRTHPVDPGLEISALTLTATATHGSAWASVHAIRAMRASEEIGSANEGAGSLRSTATR
jgi:hypothetical protein